MTRQQRACLGSVGGVRCAALLPSGEWLKELISNLRPAGRWLGGGGVSSAGCWLRCSLGVGLPDVLGVCLCMLPPALGLLGWRFCGSELELERPGSVQSEQCSSSSDLYSQRQISVLLNAPVNCYNL